MVIFTGIKLAAQNQLPAEVAAGIFFRDNIPRFSIQIINDHL